MGVQRGVLRTGLSLIVDVSAVHQVGCSVFRGDVTVGVTVGSIGRVHVQQVEKHLVKCALRGLMVNSNALVAWALASM